MTAAFPEDRPAGERDKPAHLEPALIGLVVLGGTLGTAAREGLNLSIRTPGSFPLTVFLINVVGAFALGVLLEGLASGGTEPRRARVRLVAGTGFLGGFTTYSALATGTDLLFRAGDAGTGILYATATLLIGLVASAVGVGIGVRLRRARLRRSRA